MVVRSGCPVNEAVGLGTWGLDLGASVLLERLAAVGDEQGESFVLGVCRQEVRTSYSTCDMCW